MHAITVIQPYAYSIAFLGKDVENRDRAPTLALIGHRVAIHAGMKPIDRYACALIEGDPRIPGLIVEAKLPRGAIVATTLLRGWVAKRNGEHVGSIRGAEADAIMQSPWWIGPVGHIYADTRPIAAPVPCRGALGYWRVPEDVAGRVEEQL